MPNISNYHDFLYNTSSIVPQRQLPLWVSFTPRRMLLYCKLTDKADRKPWDYPWCYVGRDASDTACFCLLVFTSWFEISRCHLHTLMGKYTSKQRTNQKSEQNTEYRRQWDREQGWGRPFWGLIGKASVGKQHFGNELSVEAARKYSCRSHYLSYARVPRTHQ